MFFMRGILYRGVVHYFVMDSWCAAQRVIARRGSIKPPRTECRLGPLKTVVLSKIMQWAKYLLRLWRATVVYVFVSVVTGNGISGERGAPYVSQGSLCLCVGDDRRVVWRTSAPSRPTMCLANLTGAMCHQLDCPDIRTWQEQFLLFGIAGWTFVLFFLKGAERWFMCSARISDSYHSITKYSPHKIL